MSKQAESHPRSTVLQRVVMPRDTDPLDVRPLYLDEPENVHSHVASRTSVTVPVSSRVSFAAYFNAFPASYWKRWTRVEEVVLRMSVRGSGRVDVYRSKPGGDIAHLTGEPVRDAKQWRHLELRVDVRPFEDGGWVWFDVFTDDTPLEIRDAAWTTDLELPKQRLAIGTTTFNRPDDCVATLLALGEDKAVLDLVGKVFVADQGTAKISAHPRFAEAAKLLGGRLEVIDQGNIGGSGGFTRGLYEAVEHTDLEQVMLMDDDIVLEPDSILRANAFARACTKPVVVGGQMLNLQVRAQLHSMGEVVNLRECRWHAAPGAVTRHDFSRNQLRPTKQLHRRINATYNGWWMCLFPRTVVESTGLPLPLFIKWDDSEYALRAAEGGFPTVTLPGSAVWHQPWTDKDDTTDWTTYFHMRNRLILLALHSPHDVRKRLVAQGLKLTLRRLLQMQYSTVAIECRAVEDFLAGPDRLFDLLPTALPEVQAERKLYPDAQFRPSAREFPPPMRGGPPPQGPGSRAKLVLRMAKALVHNLRPPAEQAMRRPQVNLSSGAGSWQVLGALDSATVSNADGSAVAFRRRDPKTFRELAQRSARAYRRLMREWPRLTETYKSALPELTSVESWRKRFEN